MLLKSLVKQYAVTAYPKYTKKEVKIMNIYEIQTEILNCIDEETGEILNEKLIEKLQAERDKKIENIALYIKNITAVTEAIKAERDKLFERQKRGENKVKNLKEFLSVQLDGWKFITPLIEITFRKSEAVEFTGAISDEYLKQDILNIDGNYYKKCTPEFDKTFIKTVIKSGQIVDGAVLVKRNNIQIK
jgi:hypothetical protein